MQFAAMQKVFGKFGVHTIQFFKVIFTLLFVLSKASLIQNILSHPLDSFRFNFKFSAILLDPKNVISHNTKTLRLFNTILLRAKRQMTHKNFERSIPSILLSNRMNQRYLKIPTEEIKKCSLPTWSRCQSHHTKTKSKNKFSFLQYDSSQLFRLLLFISFCKHNGHCAETSISEMQNNNKEILIYMQQHWVYPDEEAGHQVRRVSSSRM